MFHMYKTRDTRPYSPIAKKPLPVILLNVFFRLSTETVEKKKRNLVIIGKYIYLVVNVEPLKNG